VHTGACDWLQWTLTRAHLCEHMETWRVLTEVCETVGEAEVKGRVAFVVLRVECCPAPQQAVTHACVFQYVGMYVHTTICQLIVCALVFVRRFSLSTCDRPVQYM
jgi:hypothetical protein